jgi:hypothetical protein
LTADTRTRLIVTAMQLFWEKGYGSTSVANVLQAARVNSGSARYRRSLADTDCTVARSAASPWNCTNRISRCASGSPRTSPPGPMRSTSA